MQTICVTIAIVIGQQQLLQSYQHVPLCPTVLSTGPAGSPQGCAMEVLVAVDCTVGATPECQEIPPTKGMPPRSLEVTDSTAAASEI